MPPRNWTMGDKPSGQIKEYIIMAVIRAGPREQRNLEGRV